MLPAGNIWLCTTKIRSQPLNRNFREAMKSYQRAFAFDSNNYAVIRDSALIQLHLRMFKDFKQSAWKALELRSDMPVNWVAYSLGCYLRGDYEHAIKILDNCIGLLKGGVKPVDKSHMLVYKLVCLGKIADWERSLEFLNENERDIVDKREVSRFKKECLWNLNRIEEYLKEIEEELKVNCENLDFIVEYLKGRGVAVSDFKSIINNSETRKIITELKEKYPKSRLIKNLLFGLVPTGEFKKAFIEYFSKEILACNPSIFSQIKYIYRHQKEKIAIIEEIVNTHLASIEKNNCLDETITDTKIHLVIYLDWVKYFAAHHRLACGQSVSALSLIDSAIGSTLTVVEFYELKARILKSTRNFKAAAAALEKARQLDSGDRYLNAKAAKACLLNGDVEQAGSVMREFINDPLKPEGVDYYQALWFEEEVALSYLKNGNVEEALKFVEYSVDHFFSHWDDQFDFQNWCLRRYVLKHYIESLEYFDRFYDNRKVERSLFLLNVIKMKAEQDEEVKSKLKERLVKAEKNIESLLRKMQNYSRNENIHLFTVKHFVSRNKPLYAIKSVKILKDINSRLFTKGDAILREFVESSPKKEFYSTFITWDKPEEQGNKSSVSDLIAETWTSPSEKSVLGLLELLKQCSGEDLIQFGRKRLDKVQILSQFIGKEAIFSQITEKIRFKDEESLLSNLHMFEETPKEIIEHNLNYCKEHGIEIKEFKPEEAKQKDN